MKSPDAIFIWIPKTGGSSMHRVLLDHFDNHQLIGQRGFTEKDTKTSVQYLKGRTLSVEGVTCLGHVDVRKALGRLLDEDYFKRAWKFCFVRNPWERLVSLYFNLKKRMDRNGIRDFTHFAEVVSQDVTPIGFYNHRRLSQANPQSDWIMEKNHCLVDFIGRFERLHSDSQKVFDMLGIHAQLPHENSSQHVHYREYYTDKTRDTVASFYRQDIEHFGYEF